MLSRQDCPKGRRTQKADGVMKTAIDLKHLATYRPDTQPVPTYHSGVKQHLKWEEILKLSQENSRPAVTGRQPVETTPSTYSPD
jgi:hypothetical protein